MVPRTRGIRTRQASATRGDRLLRGDRHGVVAARDVRAIRTLAAPDQTVSESTPSEALRRALAGPHGGDPPVNRVDRQLAGATRGLTSPRTSSRARTADRSYPRRPRRRSRRPGPATDRRGSPASGRAATRADNRRKGPISTAKGVMRDVIAPPPGRPGHGNCAWRCQSMSTETFGRYGGKKSSS